MPDTTSLPSPAPGFAAVVLGFGPMDTVHEEFGQLVQRALRSPDEGLLASLDALEAHLRAHFGAEDGWMRDTEFPARDCHVDEHAAVLRSAEEVRPLVAAGNFRVGREFVAELDRWFPGHADYLDSALAAWMCKRQYGGKPVVLHRRKSPD
jgi:hemerythrin